MTDIVNDYDQLGHLAQLQDEQTAQRAAADAAADAVAAAIDATQRLAATQRIAADTVAAAIAAAERRGYELGLAAAERRGYERGLAEASSARLADDTLTSLRRIVARLNSEVEALSEYDPADDVEVGDAEELCVPSEDDSLSEVSDWLQSYGGEAMLRKDEVTVSADGVEDEIASRCARLREALGDLSRLLP